MRIKLIKSKWKSETDCRGWISRSRVRCFYLYFAISRLLVNFGMGLLAYIYIRFNQKLDEKSCIRAKIETVKRRWNCIT